MRGAWRWPPMLPRKQLQPEPSVKDSTPGASTRRVICGTSSKQPDASPRGSTDVYTLPRKTCW